MSPLLAPEVETILTLGADDPLIAIGIVRSGAVVVLRDLRSGEGLHLPLSRARALWAGLGMAIDRVSSGR